jgi:integrase
LDCGSVFAKVGIHVVGKLGGFSN